MIIVRLFSAMDKSIMHGTYMYRVGGKQPTTRHMFYLQRTELGHFNLYPWLLQGIKPRALAGLSWQFIIGQQSALNCTGWVPGFDLNKNILPNGWSMPCSDCLLVVTMEICHVRCYYTEGSGKSWSSWYSNWKTLTWCECYNYANECMSLQERITV